MKNFNILFFAIIFMAIPFACNSQTNQLQSENEVKKVIVGETEAFFEKDFEKAKSFSSNDPKAASIQSLPDGTVTTQIGGVIVNPGEQSKEKVDYSSMAFKILGHSHWNINVRDNVAWANYRQKTSLEGTEYISDEIRVLAKEKGEWKIILSSTIVH